MWFHTGIDLAAPAGLPVFAVAAGTVRVVEFAIGFGIHVLLSPSQQQGATVVYLYGHLSGVAVPDGDVVARGRSHRLRGERPATAAGLTFTSRSTWAAFR